MEENSFDTVTESSRSIWRGFLLVFVLLGVVSVLVYAAYHKDFYGIQHKIQHLQGTEHSHEIVYDYGLDSASSDATEQVINPTGKLLLSLALDLEQGTYMYEQSLADQEFTAVEVLPAVEYGPTLHYVAMDNDISRGGFVLTRGNESEELFENDPLDGGVYFVADFDAFANGSLLRIEQPEGKNESSYSWSAETKKLAYHMSDFVDTFEEFSDISNYEVVIYDSESNAIERQIPDAVSPNWSPNGSFLLYLRKDGLYQHSLELNQEERVLATANDAFGNGLSSFDSFKVSDNGQYALWLTPYRNLITVYEISSWYPFSITEIGRIQNIGTEYYWPTFSPDGEFYAVKAMDRDIATSEVSNARIEVRPVTSRKPVRVYSIDSFNPLGVYIDDWVLASGDKNTESASTVDVDSEESSEESNQLPE